ncbi:MAG TPA: CBS domain-containing protein [Chloroflexota bacterium]|nr:CBS domain-containing protein [Chloroflexota bacterium]
METPPSEDRQRGRPPQVAADLMERNPRAVSPETRVGEVARILLEWHLSGVPVVRDDGTVVGVVTQIDLVRRHAHVHLPLYLELLGSVIPLGGERRFREDFRRITGRTAAEVMTAPAPTVQEDTPIDDVASRLTEPGGDPVIVVRQDRLVGLITGAHLVRLVVVEETSG